MKGAFMNKAQMRYQKELMRMLEEIYKSCLSEAIKEGIKRKKIYESKNK